MAVRLESVIDTIADYDNLYDIVSYQIETELLRTRRRLMDEELDRQIREMESTMSNGHRPNIQMMDEAEDIPDFTNHMSIQRNTTTITGNESYRHIAYYGTGGGLESQIAASSRHTYSIPTEADLRSYMEDLSRSINEQYRWSTPSYWNEGDQTQSVFFGGTDPIDIMDEYMSYKGNKIAITEKDVKRLKVEVLVKLESTNPISSYDKKYTLVIEDSNESLYREALLQAKMEKFDIEINGNKWKVM